MNNRDQAQQLVSQMTLEEKAGLCSGKNFWQLKGVERLGLEPIMVTDGPHGLRKQAGSADHLGLSQSVPATSFPTASASACSFDRDLLRRMGVALGEKCVSENVAVILGPGANIKRSPMCGRNFEYFSEDPYLTGEMAAALIDGVQSQGVGTSLKHYAVNNQEKRRMTSDSVVDERTLREIYLTGFEKAVRQSQPWTVMCSYNKINGTYASDHEELLTRILRDEWGFEGLVVSDWGAVNARVAGVRAGMDLQMPGPDNSSDEAIVEAVRSGDLSETDLDRVAVRITELILKGQAGKDNPVHSDSDHNMLAAEIARQSAVLLKNDKGLLPLNGDERVAVIGQMAQTPRYQGAGSSRINPAYLDNALDALKADGVQVDYAQGYNLSDNAVDEKKIDEACQLAANCDVAIVFAGLPDAYESEGFDRTDLAMPESHDRLIEAVTAVNSKTIVVLQCGAPVVMPWQERVAAILIMYLGGQAGGQATSDLLLGKANPSGKLAETFPQKLEDCPSTPWFGGEGNAVHYREGLYVGYRYFDTAKVKPAFPFGFGLSYTTFDYSDLTVESLGSYKFRVSANITNDGQVAGSEIAQLYVRCKAPAVFRADKALKGFAKVHLEPGETGTVTFELDQRSFAYYNTKAKGWCIEGGDYEILLAQSSDTVRLSETIQLDGDGQEQLLLADYKDLTDYRKPSVPFKVRDAQFEQLLGRTPPDGIRKPGEAYTVNSTLSDIQKTLIGKYLLSQAKKQTAGMIGEDTDPTQALMMEAVLMEMPIRAMKMTGGNVSDRQLEAIVDLANGHVVRGLRKALTKD